MSSFEEQIQTHPVAVAAVVAVAALIVVHRLLVVVCERCARQQRRALRDDYELLPTSRWTCEAARVGRGPRLA